MQIGRKDINNETNSNRKRRDGHKERKKNSLKYLTLNKKRKTFMGQ